MCMQPRPGEGECACNLDRPGKKRGRVCVRARATSTEGRRGGGGGCVQLRSLLVSLVQPPFCELDYHLNSLVDIKLNWLQCKLYECR